MNSLFWYLQCFYQYMSNQISQSVGKGYRQFRTKSIPLIMTLSTFFGPIFTKSNKSVNEFFVVVRIVLSGCTNSAGSCVIGNVMTISSHKTSATAKYNEYAKRLHIPLSCAILFIFLDLFFLTKFWVVKLIILDFVIAFSNLLLSPLHSLIKVSLLHSYLLITDKR